jgi:hypothetical protein
MAGDGGVALDTSVRARAMRPAVLASALPGVGVTATAAIVVSIIVAASSSLEGRSAVALLS